MPEQKSEVPHLPRPSEVPLYTPPKETVTTLRPFSSELKQRIRQLAADIEAKARERRRAAIPTRKGSSVQENLPVSVSTVPDELRPAFPDVDVSSSMQLKPPEVVEVPPEKKFQLNSDNLAEEVASGRLKRTSIGLIDGVALFGSTHVQANWREESSAPALSKEEIYSYNPRMDDWNPDLHPAAEALAMSEMSVLAMRIENKDMVDGSLGSMVELGIALLSAKLNGQRVVISLEANIEQTLKESGALAQYIALENALVDAQRLYPGLVTVQRGGTLEQFNTAVKTAVEDQRDEAKAMKPEVQQLKEYSKRRVQRLQQTGLMKVFGGSSAPFSRTNTDIKDSFATEQDRIKEVWGRDVFALNQGLVKMAWDGDPVTGDGVGALPYDAALEQRVARLRWAASMESGIKRNADVLIWSIQDEAVSKAAITEIGFLLLNAMETGQLAMILLEPFNADLYVNTVFIERRNDLAIQAEEVILAAERAGKPFDQSELDKYRMIEKKLMSTDFGPLTAKEVKASKIIFKTQIFTDYDNVRRTRAVIEAQMLKMREKLKARKDEIGDPFFEFATSVDEYWKQAVRLQAFNQWNINSGMNVTQSSVAEADTPQ